jgi:hypothetical protein
MVINRDGTRTRHYSMLKYLNGEVLAWAPTLLRLKSAGVYHTEPLPVMTQSIDESTLVEFISGGMWLIGEFTDENGSSYMMVVNRDFIGPAELQLKFRQAPEELLEVSKQTGDEQSTTRYSRTTGKLTQEFAAGDGMLFCIKE